MTEPFKFTPEEIEYMEKTINSIINRDIKCDKYDTLKRDGWIKISRVVTSANDKHGEFEVHVEAYRNPDWEIRRRS